MPARQPFAPLIGWSPKTHSARAGQSGRKGEEQTRRGAHARRVVSATSCHQERSNTCKRGNAGHLKDLHASRLLTQTHHNASGLPSPSSQPRLVAYTSVRPTVAPERRSTSSQCQPRAGMLFGRRCGCDAARPWRGAAWAVAWERWERRGFPKRESTPSIHHMRSQHARPTESALAKRPACSPPVGGSSDREIRAQRKKGERRGEK